MSAARVALLSLAALAWLAAPACAVEPTDRLTLEWLESMPTTPVTVETGRKRHRFTAWVASTPVQKARGLMYVKSLDPGRGMLFLFERPEYASFWMRNTYIPLDLIFIGPDGRIVNIAERAEPLSTRLLESAAPVTAVLEVPGGTAARLGIRAGDRVESAATGPAR